MKKTNIIFAVLIALAFAFMACESTNPGDPDSNTDTGVEYCSISVTTSPEGASVFLDDALQGVSPLVINDLPPGSYDVRATLDGYEPEVTTVNLAEGSDLPLSLTLRPEATTWDLNGRWTQIENHIICDIEQMGNEVTGFNPVGTMTLEGNSLSYEDSYGSWATGEVADNDHVSITFYDPFDDRTFDYTYVRN